MDVLKKKRVLFFYLTFFEYHTHIKKALEYEGAIVTPVKLDNFTLLYNLLNLSNKKIFLEEYKLSYQKKILSNIKSYNFDYVFFVQGFQLTDFLLDSLREKMPSSKFILYNWDAIRSFNYLVFKDYFDLIFSFDPIDCEQHKDLVYLPLFFCNSFGELHNKSRRNEKKYHISFIGNVGNIHRYNFVNFFKEISENLDLNFFSYLYIKRTHFLKNLLQGRVYKNVHFSQLNLKDVAEIYSNTIAVIDFPNPLQNGLTMRTFEVLGGGLKLITTNKNIINEPFYDENVVSVINPLDINISKEFLLTEINNDFNKKMSYYSISNWVKHIFEGRI